MNTQDSYGSRHRQELQRSMEEPAKRRKRDHGYCDDEGQWHPLNRRKSDHDELDIASWIVGGFAVLLIISVIAAQLCIRWIP